MVRLGVISNYRARPNVVDEDDFSRNTGNMPREMNIFEVFRLIEEHLHRQDVAKAQALIGQVLAVPGLPPEYRTYVRIYESDCLNKQNRFDDARRSLGLVLDEAGTNEHVKAMALVLLAGIDMRVGVSVDTSVMLEEARAIAVKVHDNALHGDATFNLAVIKADAGDSVMAERLFNEARKSYAAAGRQTRVVDCDHALATLRRIEEVENDDDLDAMRDAMMAAIVAEDFAQIARVGGDLARTHYCHYSEGRGDENLEAASQILLHVLVAQDVIWDAAARAEHRVGARIELATDMFNNLETALLIRTAQNQNELALSLSARAKARILRDEAGDRNVATIEAFRARDSRMADLALDGVAAQALPLALDEIANVGTRRVAFIDQFAMSGDVLLLNVDVTGGAGDSCTWHQLQAWPHASAPSSSARLGRGQGQGATARRAQTELLNALELFSGRAALLYDSRVTPDTEQRESILGMQREIEPHLQDFGRWMFPASLVGRLQELGVQHVIVSPDPRLFDIPFHALIIEDGTCVLDQPWTLSVLPSALGLYDVIRRRREMKGATVHALAPQRDVNEHLGGKEEIAEVVRHRPDTTVHWREAADRSCLASAAESAAWIHIRSHGTGSAAGYVPKLADGPWVDPLASTSSPFLVSTCCRTGETTARGQDVFGFVEMVERSDFAGVLTPIISLEGFAATLFMKTLYERLSTGAFICDAVKAAAKATREVIPHAAAWGAFSCVGEPWATLPPTK